MKNIVQGNDQDGVILQTPTAAELNAVAEVPESDGGSRSVGVVVSAADALTKNYVKLSKYKKLRLEHQGFIENAIEMKTEPSWERIEVQVGLSTTQAYAYVAPETRNIKQNPYAKTESDVKITEAGTFSKISGYQFEDGDKKLGYFESIRYDQNAISVSASSGTLVQPVAALAADEELAQQIDTTYRKGQNLFTPIDAENYLSRAGMEVKTSETYLAQKEAEAEEETVEEPSVEDVDLP